MALLTGNVSFKLNVLRLHLECSFGVRVHGFQVRNMYCLAQKQAASDGESGRSSSRGMAGFLGNTGARVDPGLGFWGSGLGLRFSV